MAQKPTGERTHPAAFIRRITPGSSVLDPRPRAIYVNVSGTIDITNSDATTDTLTVVAGTTIPGQFWKITAATSATISGYFDQ